MSNTRQICPTPAENICDNCHQELHLVTMNYLLVCEECGMVYDEDRYVAQSAFIHDANKNATRSDKVNITQTKIGCAQDYHKVKSKINFQRLQKIQTIACNDQKQMRLNCFLGHFRELNSRYGYDFQLSILRSEAEKLYQQLPVGSPDRNLETISKIIYYFYARKQGIRITLHELTTDQSCAKLLRHVWRMKKRTINITNTILKISTNEHLAYNGNLVSKWCAEFNCDMKIFNDAVKFASMISGKAEIRACAGFIVAARLNGIGKELQAYQLAKEIGISQSCLYARANTIAETLGFSGYTGIRSKVIKTAPIPTPSITLKQTMTPIRTKIATSSPKIIAVAPITISIPTPATAISPTKVFSHSFQSIMKSPFIAFLTRSKMGLRFSKKQKKNQSVSNLTRIPSKLKTCYTRSPTSQNISNSLSPFINRLRQVFSSKDDLTQSVRKFSTTSFGPPNRSTSKETLLVQKYRGSG